MKKIDELLEVGYCQHGQVITAENLQKWAYNQLSVAPDLLEACKTALSFISIVHGHTEGDMADQIKQAISKAEGRE